MTPSHCPNPPSKGLEFSHVAAIGWAEGQLPNYKRHVGGGTGRKNNVSPTVPKRAEDSRHQLEPGTATIPRYPDRSPSRFLAPI